MSFTISTAEVSPFLSVLQLFAMPTCRSTRGIIFWDVPKGGLFSAHSMFDTVVAAALLLLFMLTVIPLHPPLAPDEIRFDSIIRLRSHKPIHCGTLLCKLMRSPQRTMPLHHLHNQTFRSAAIRSAALSFILKAPQPCRGWFLFMNLNSLCWTPQHHVIASMFMANKSRLCHLFTLGLSFHNSVYHFELDQP